MTKDEIKKALKCCIDWDTCPDCPYFNNGNRNCSDTMKIDALNLITEQEKDYSKLQEMFANYQLASDKEIRAQVKQAKIDVLNKAKERIKTAIDTYYNSDGGGYYLAEDAIDDIDELIKEVQNGK